MRFFIFSFLITLSGATHAQSIQLDQRADELKEWLVDKYGIDSGRIEAVGKEKILLLIQWKREEPASSYLNNIIDRIRKRPCIRVGLFRYFEWR